MDKRLGKDKIPGGFGACVPLKGKSILCSSLAWALIRSFCSTRVFIRRL